MKTYRLLVLFIVSVFISADLSAQTVDDVLKDYIAAIGGQKNLNKINSLQMKAKIVSDMFQADATTTLLNGKGYKVNMDIMGMQVETCYTEEGGWSSDPMSGSIVEIPDDQFKINKGALYVSGPYANFKDLGLSAELVGQANVNGVNAYQIRFTVDGTDTSADHFFDPDTHLLIRTTAMVDAQGSLIKAVTDYKDYKEVEGGIKIAHVQEIDYGGMMSMTNTIASVEVNPEVDPAIFVKK